MNKIYKDLLLPDVFYQDALPFWDDPHISKYLLDAHLNPVYEGATRNLSFVEDSLTFINTLLPASAYPHLLDVGCGPGIYTERFCMFGYQVTGIDFSKRSIDYAKTSAHMQQLPISYRYEDYLQLSDQDTYNLVTMIYCDYGALSMDNRKKLLNNIYDSLQHGGKLLLDVFTVCKEADFIEKQTWQHCGKSGFWMEGPHILLQNNKRYPNHITLEQTTILTAHGLQTYHIWSQYFTKELLIKEVTNARFKVLHIYEDICGRPYTSNSTTMAILLEK